MDADKIKQALRRKPPPKTTISPKDLLSTGSTTLNLACSGHPRGGFAKGKYYLLVGDSASGKTWLCLSLFAEAAINRHFKDYRFVYDSTEDGALMDLSAFFGQQMAKRLEPHASTTTEEFYYGLDDLLASSQPFLYVLDSMDTLESEEDQEKFQERKKASRKGKETSGTYGLSKPKQNSAYLRKAVNALRKSGSILVIVSQTRANIAPFAFEKKTRAGGNALKFYATLELWTSVKEHIKKTVKGKPRELGIICLVKVKKNRIIGKQRDVLLPIYHSHGIDDVGACVQYLLSEGHWKESGGKIAAPDLQYTGKLEGLLSHVEEQGLELDLQSIVAEVWNGIEAACAFKRKARY